MTTLQICTALRKTSTSPHIFISTINTLRTGDADLRFYITTVQDG